MAIGLLQQATCIQEPKKITRKLLMTVAQQTIVFAFVYYFRRNCLLRIMPWASIDGFLYEAVLQNWFYVMLTYSLSYPSTPFNCFVNRFCHLKPIDIYFLLDVSFSSIFFYVTYFYIIFLSICKESGAWK